MLAKKGTDSWQFAFEAAGLAFAAREFNLASVANACQLELETPEPRHQRPREVQLFSGFLVRGTESLAEEPQFCV